MTLTTGRIDGEGEVVKYPYEYRFREQDGDWSPWYPCTSGEASMKDGRPEYQVRETQRNNQ